MYSALCRRTKAFRVGQHMPENMILVQNQDQNTVYVYTVHSFYTYAKLG